MNRVGDPVRVCLVTHRWAPSFSGAAHRFRQYLPSLRDRGVEVDVVCSTAPGPESPDGARRWQELGYGDALPAEDVEGTAVHRVKLPGGRSFRRNKLLRRAVVRHLAVTPAHVAHFLTLEPLRTNHAGSLKAAGVSSLFTGTQLWSFSPHAVKRALQRFWIRIPIQRADHVIVSSSVMREYFQTLGVTRPISIIPNGVDLQRFQGVDERGKYAARQALGLAREASVVLFIGSIIARKGVDLLVDAFARVVAEDRASELVLVGPRDDSGSEEARAFDSRLGAAVHASGLDGKVHFVGYQAAIDGYLNAEDVFVLPSRREGLGNVVLEAMAAGIPTVLTPYLGLPREFGEPGEQYVLSAPDPDSLASNILSLIGDRSRARTVGERGRSWVTDRLSLSNAIESYAQVYQDLALYGSVKTHTSPWIE